MPLSIFGHGNNGTAHWESVPNVRGTWDLLSSCLITLVLCVYTSIHLNIPSDKPGLWEEYGRKVKWALVGLFAPEIVVFCAWSQRAEAMRVARELREHFGQPEMEAWYCRIWDRLRSKKKNFDSTKLSDYWSNIHGFYIVMGGYAMDITGDEKRVWPVGTDRVALSPDVVINLFKQKYSMLTNVKLPYVSKREIQDKSKANRLAKFIVCIQALWFCTQFFSRIEQRLPVSLLELSTLAHAVCALLTYAFWWQKPLDIEEPTLLRSKDSEDVRKLCALSCSVSSTALWTYQERHLSKIKNMNGGDLHIITAEGVDLQHRLWPVGPYHGFYRHLGPRWAYIKPRIHSDPEDQWVTLLSSARIPSTPFYVAPVVNSIKLDRISITRLGCLSVDDLFLDPGERFSLSRAYLKLGTNDWYPRILNLSLGEISGLIIIFTIFGLIYGGLHLLVWGAYRFESSLRYLIWKVSAIMVICTGPGVFIISGVLNYYGWGTYICDEDLYQIFIILGPITITYMGARVFLVIEVFLNIPYVDPGVYKTTEVGKLPLVIFVDAIRRSPYAVQASLTKII